VPAGVNIDEAGKEKRRKGITAEDLCRRYLV